MTRFITILTIIVSTINATALHTVLTEKIPLDQNHTGTLSLQMGHKTYLADQPARILIDYENNGTKKQFLFSDTATKFPIYYFDKMSIHSTKDALVDLTNQINLFDTNNDKKNEIFVYGNSYYGINGYVGKVVILTQDQNSTIKPMGLITTFNLAKIYYIKRENIIVVAQALWGSKTEESSKHKHHYQIDVYEMAYGLKKIPLFITERNYSDQHGFIIKDVIERIITQYNLKRKDKKNG